MYAADRLPSLEFDMQVTMVEAEGAKSAIQDPNPVIDGRKANVNLAYLGAKPRGVQSTGELILTTSWGKRGDGWAEKGENATSWGRRERERT